MLEVSGTGPMWDYEVKESAEYYDESWGDYGIDEYSTAPWEEKDYTIINICIGEGVTRIGNYAFRQTCFISGYNVVQSTNIFGQLSISSTVTEIGDWAFHGCYRLKGELVFPEGLRYIGNHSFRDCNSLSGDLMLPDSVEYIGEDAFGYCTGLNGELKLPNGLAEISTMAFAGCKGIKGDIIIPDSVKIIGEYAFLQCSGFDGALRIGKNVEEISKEAFAQCFGISCIAGFSERLQTIGDYAFYYCMSVSGNLIIPSSVNRIGDSAFLVWDNSNHTPTTYLDSVEFLGDAPEDFGWRVFGLPENVPEGFIIFYHKGTTGWTTPEWEGYPCYTMDELPDELSHVESVSLDISSLSLQVNDTYTLVAEINPFYAKNKAVKWETSDPSVATVADGVVTAKSDGTVIITATTEDGAHTATCEVTVTRFQRGDVNGDDKLDSDDAIYLLRYTLNPARYPITQSGDMNGDGHVDSDDAIYLLRHTLNQDRYPLK